MMTIKRLFSAVALSALLLVSVLPLWPTAAWYDASYRYRYAITVDNSGNASTLTSYAVKISLTSGNFDFTKAQSDGSDIRVTADDGTTLIPYTILAYSSVGQTGEIWVKVPSIPGSSATSLYVYCGNVAPTAFDVPPVGPYTKYAARIDSTAGRLAENIVWDATTAEYWLVWADQTNNAIGLSHSTDLITWTPYASNPILTTGDTESSPHLLLSGGTWHLYFAKGSPPNVRIYVRTASAVTGPYGNEALLLSPGAAGGWEDARVLEPYVFERSPGDWVMLYMGDAGSTVEQVGYATATSPTGPFAKYASNPVLAFGPAGSYDAGTVADPYALKVGGAWYIGYAVSGTISRPWQQAWATTTDWITFAKGNIHLGVGDVGAWDAGNAHRGAWSRFGDYYYLSYTGYPSNTYQMGLATQYAKSTAVGYPPEQVFGFYEDFAVAPGSHVRRNPAGGSEVVSGGIITLTSGTGGAANMRNMYSIQEFGYGSIFESLVKRPANGVTIAGENGFAGSNSTWGNATGGNARIYDFNNTKWQLVTNLGTAATITNSTNTRDTDWHTQSVWMVSSSLVKFKTDAAAAWEQNTTNIPTITLPAMVSSLATSTTPNTFQVDWVRARPYSEPEPTITLGAVQDGRTGGNALMFSIP